MLIIYVKFRPKKVLHLMGCYECLKTILFAIKMEIRTTETNS